MFMLAVAWDESTLLYIFGSTPFFCSMFLSQISLQEHSFQLFWHMNFKQKYAILQTIRKFFMLWYIKYYHYFRDSYSDQLHCQLSRHLKSLFAFFMHSFVQ